MGIFDKVASKATFRRETVVVSGDWAESLTQAIQEGADFAVQTSEAVITQNPSAAPSGLPTPPGPSILTPPPAPAQTPATPALTADNVPALGMFDRIRHAFSAAPLAASVAVVAGVGLIASAIVGVKRR